MNKILNNKIYLFVLVLVILFLKTNVTSASSVIISPSKDYIGTEEQFYVDVSIDTMGSSINGLEGTVNFNNEYLSLLRVEEGKSIVNLWVEKPRVTSDGIVKFSGIVTNGFSGVIDPFNSKVKLPGIVARFVFKSLKPGESNITSLPFSVTLNDGLGTITTTTSVTKTIDIQDIRNPIVYNNTNDVNPELNYEIIKDPNIFDNKYVLIFQAKDKGTGIDNVMIKEGSKDWEKIESPYLLKDQSRHSRITLQATNFSGSSIIINIDRVPYNWNVLIYLSILIFISILVLVIRKLYVKNK